MFYISSLVILLALVMDISLHKPTRDYKFGLIHGLIISFVINSLLYLVICDIL